ncbi:glycogen synthase GlgA [Raoultella terrigena]|uniref:glycogen synthase GlgA n=1 Tax=Raoultella terrigena TaxID=577 RepID=UPI0005F81668|nr:glycogen synthase GlgA [Raoultella terrigena]
MQVLHVGAEMFPLLKTGGLADVTGALPAAQIAEGLDTRVLLPGFPAIRSGLQEPQAVASRETFAGPMTLLFGHFNGVGIYLIDAPHLYDRPGNPYHDQQMQDYPDNVLRFALLSWVGAELAGGLDPFWRPEIVHAHDWHAGLMPAYLAARGHPARSVFTVHNIAYQGLFQARHMAEIALPWSLFQMHGVEFKGQISFLKAGLYFADHITTVSPTYAREITEPQYAFGLEELLRQRQREGRLSGILNGVDESIWDPRSDSLLAAHYDSTSLAEKAKNKRQLQETLGLKADARALLFTVVSRLTSQKGLDLLLGALPGLVEQGGQLALLGSGDPDLQARFLAAEEQYPGQVSIRIGYDEALSHQLIGGADVILVPSRFEPCGLTQLYGLRYGTLPLVRRTGGLADTVADCSLENLADGLATGFVFADSEIGSLSRAIRRAFVLWSRPSLWRYVQRQAMSMDFSWQSAAKSFHQLYQRII